MGAFSSKGTIIYIGRLADGYRMAGCLMKAETPPQELVAAGVTQKAWDQFVAAFNMDLAANFKTYMFILAPFMFMTVLTIAGALVGFPYFYVLMFPYALVMLYMVMCRMPKKVQTALDAHLVELESDCGIKVEAVYFQGYKALRARITFVKIEGSGPEPLLKGKFDNVND